MTLPLLSDLRRVEADPPRSMVVAGRKLTPSVVFDTYWEFAARRQEIYHARLTRRPWPWTSDPILKRYRFTNCFRAADRVSQYLIRNVIYQSPQDWHEVFFRTVLFKLFNRTSTWNLLQTAFGEVGWHNYRFTEFDRVLSRALDAGERLYSAAYVIPPPRLGEDRKHRNHLRLLELFMKSGAPELLRNASTMREAFGVLRSFPAMGDFLAYQFLIDLNYTQHLQFEEMEFVVPGPGARDGIRKCFGTAADGIEAEVIRYMADTQEEHFAQRGLNFRTLGGRSLQLIDCQNLFCEVDKYARVAHPEVSGISGRSRIKQSYQGDQTPVTAWFPPKWGINEAMINVTGDGA